ncbi:MAG: alpha-glucosidase [Sphaerochaetaceae bacterium]|jgi:alpha-glucosidase|nr:alpha-glucosidase [Sphaerochaetaceae bacterium]NLO60844.1 alpha-glucosidase [Spirochaetales bacterium]MDD3670928.1 alpha-glucosidase [Sphaerochaetaceae bacterium]MDD4259361.1 alpha-glucosidase [Sphaerochaetaceae bacterium]MDD4840993.1 alpha-glucosidase [Sphaerochaetaceae bacterium]
MNRFASWWKEGVIYQIYPRSFQDSNGDGIGDLRGIIERLDYLKWLGIVAIWLSPIFRSPMHDFGYDISDYKSIDPIFGNNDDIDELIKKAHQSGIRIILDMVLNHTSNQHPWFIESAKGIPQPKRSFYIWQDPVKGKKPNKWKAAFGGNAWEFDAVSGQYYLHSFLKEQPDLNWRNPDVEEAIFKELSFWLEKQVDGFRLDVINLIVKDEAFRNNPFAWGQTIRPYDMQQHIFDRDRPETHEILKRMRSHIDTYENRMLVGEIMVEKPGNPRIVASYQGEDGDELNLAFNFSFNWLPMKAKTFEQTAQIWYESLGLQRWPCWVLSNHDVTRAITRFGNQEEKARIAAMFLLTQKGTPFLYYGEEIGMKDKRVTRNQIQDPVGKRYWPFHPGRDGQRRPMQWGPSRQFCQSDVSPWLPYHPEHKKNNVETQIADVNSLLHMYRNLIAIRNHDEALRIGRIKFLQHDIPDVLCYVRESEALIRLILLNFSKKEREIPSSLIAHALGDPSFRVLFNTRQDQIQETSDSIILRGYQGLLLCEGE